MKNGDFYKLLDIGRKFTGKELDDAFQTAKQKVRYNPALRIDAYEEAYRTLRDPNKRKLYDEKLDRMVLMKEMVSKAEQTPVKKQDSSRLTIYLSLAVLLSVIFLVFTVPKLFSSESFDVGDSVYRNNGKKLGTIVEYSGSYSYGGGKSSPSFRIETPEGESIWVPVVDVKAGCTKF